MYNYEWDNITGGYVLADKSTGLEREIRPVFFEELKFLKLDKNFGWHFPKSKFPLCWAQGRRYFFRGEVVAESVGGELYTMPTLKNVVQNLSLTPVNLKAMIAKNEDLLSGLTQQTIGDIYSTFEDHKDKVDLVYVGFSGGKDSSVTLDLVQRALPHNAFEVIFGDTTMELSDTYETVDATKKFFPNLSWQTARAPFAAPDSWQFMGPPARNLRWCCPLHKVDPSLRKAKEIIAARRELNENFFRTLAFVGVRAAESERRATYKRLAASNHHSAQTNFYPILNWSSAEIFLYLFARKLPLNKTYRKGLARVGCKLCPMASQWTDCVQNYFYPKELAPLITVIRQTIDKGFTSEKQWRDYLNDQGWKKRNGGKILAHSEKKITAAQEGNLHKFVVSNANYSWRKWMPLLGDFVAVDRKNFSLQFEGESILINAETRDNKEIISLHHTNEKNFTRLLSSVKNILNKAAFCRNCGNCVIKCPYGALTITADDVSVTNCQHCGRCSDKPSGCLAAQSWKCEGEPDVTKIKGFDRYKTFGLRTEWIKILFENPHAFRQNTRMGSKMFVSFDNWGRDVGLLAAKETLANNFDKLRSLGAENLKLWALFWVNAAYNSPTINIYVRKVDFDLPYDNEDLLSIFGDEHKPRTKTNALTALKNTFRASPIGTKLRQGLCTIKGNSVVSVVRSAWQNPDPTIILYTLYKFAEHADDLYSFTVTNLLADNNERTALSPKILFGVDKEILRPILQGLANDYPHFICADFNKEIQENIFLNREKNSADVIQLL